MDSYIKLKNGLIINIKNIDAFGPLRPYKIYSEGKGYYITTYLIQENENLPTGYAVPIGGEENDCYDGVGVEGYDFIIITKSGNKILITKAEYDNILKVMKLSAENYACFDDVLEKFDL